MAKVPYTPYPTASPQAIPTPTIQENTPGAAFGENIAVALKQLGSTAEQSGGEIFQRAMAMQDLRNETEAREADSKYAEQQGLMHADYTSTEGKAAVDGLPTYIQKSKELRASIRGSLSNPMAQKIYDSSSLGFLQRNIFNAAGHAGNENKRWTIGAANAQMDVDSREFIGDPTNDAAYNSKLAKVRAGVATIARAQNWEEGGPQEQDLLLKRSSQLRQSQVMEVARTDPQLALGMLEQHKTDFTEQDYEHATDFVRAQNRAVGGTVLANSVYKPDKSLKDMEDEVRAKSPALAKGDPLFVQHAISDLRGRYNQDRYATAQENHTNEQTVYEAIGKGVKDERELRLDPKISAAIDAAPPSFRNSLPAKINAFNAARDKAANEEAYTKAMGMTYTDRESFLNLDIQHLNVSQPQMLRLMAARAQILKNPQDDPRVSRAIGWMQQARGPELEALGIRRYSENNKDDYNHYVGAMQSAIDVWTQEKGKAPSYHELVDDIGPQVIRQRAEPGVIFGNYWPGKKPFFQQSVPSGWGDDLKAAAQSRGEAEPSDEEIYKAYVRSQFIKLYHKEKPSGE